jgi:hypothetical protein
MNEKPFKIRKVSDGVFFIDIFFEDKKVNKPIWCLLRSDAHHDNPHSDNDMERRHLDQALQRKAFILDNGDAFCAMQGKGDPRASKDDIKEEHKGGNYLDKLVDSYADWLKPYAENILVMGKGNHETAVYKHRETDLTQRLVNSLNGKTNAKIKSGQIANWIGIRARCLQDPKRRSMGTVWFYMFHGAGGGGPVTKGVIGANRMGVTHPDANIIATGHTHDSWFLPNARARITANGVEYIDEQLHIKIPTYKNEYGVKDSGFHMEKGRPPKPLGAVWIKFYMGSRPELAGSEQLKYEATRAD